MSSPVPEVTVQEAADAAAGNSVLLLDVREDDEWEAGHARGAVHMPLGSLDPKQFRADVPVVAVCRSGTAAEPAGSGRDRRGQHGRRDDRLGSRRPSRHRRGRQRRRDRVTRP